MTKIAMKVNGKDVELDVPDRTLLIHALRDHLRLTGSHIGCDTSQCGACTVHLDGQAVKSCAMLAVQVDGHHVTTIEGIAENGNLHPMQESFREHHGLQCGYCTPGMIMAGIDIAKRLPEAGEMVIRQQLDGNICRCTGYQNIVLSIKAGIEKMGESA